MKTLKLLVFSGLLLASLLVPQRAAGICENGKKTYWGCTDSCSGGSCCTHCQLYDCETHEAIPGREYFRGDC